MSDGAVELPPRKMLADDVYDAIKKSIVTNRLPSGSKINLDQLSREIGVSNTPIRHALSRLEAEGLVVKTPYRGYGVTDLLDYSRLEYVYEARLTIEAPVAALAAERRSEEQLRQLKDYLDEAGRDLAAAGPLDTSFHIAVAAASGNPVFDEHIGRLLNWTVPVGDPYHTQGGAQRAWEEHAEIFDGVKRGDGEAAAAAMRRHLENARERFRRMREHPAE